MAKASMIAKNAAVNAIRDKIRIVGGGKKKFDDPKVEGKVAGLRDALAAVEGIAPAA